MCQKLLLIITLLVSNSLFAQFNEIAVKRNEGRMLQSKYGSYVYTGSNLGNLQKLKTELYSFFDRDISLDIANYDPVKQPASTFLFFIYKQTSFITPNLKIVENESNKNIFPGLKDQDRNVIAVVRYDIASFKKKIIFYQNAVPIKQFYFDIEKNVDESFKEQYSLKNF